jgi:hypothetical protein
MESDVTFRWALDSTWFEEAHDDRPPARYRSIAMWSRNLASDSAIAHVFDNFGGDRRFLGHASSDAIEWTRDTTERGARLETFTYRRVDADTYWYAWHVRLVNQVAPVLGDSLTCRRKTNGP